jgi:hypothetical protein
MVVGTNATKRHIYETSGANGGMGHGIFLWLDPICEGASCDGNFFVVPACLVLADSA